MKIGVFPRPPEAARRALSGPGWVTAKAVTDYSFQAPGRIITMAGLQIGKIMEIRVLDYRNPRKGNAIERRFYAVVQVFPERAEAVQKVMDQMKVAPDGVLDFDALAI